MPEPGVYAFDRFLIDAAERRLLRDGQPVEVTARYFDALLLMVENPAQLISRDRFLDEAWRGVPVTDEALSQCITQLRKTLGDSPGRPRFIETVPKHGYRFIAPVNATGPGAAPPGPSGKVTEVLSLALAAALGGAAAGISGGLLYGFGAGTPPGVGAASLLMVMVAIGVMAGLAGGFGVGIGVGGSRALTGGSPLSDAVGGAVGGAVIGAVVTLLGLDAFTVLLGRAPVDVGGSLEGLVLGAAVGGGMHLVARAGWPSPIGAALCGGAAGAALPYVGGRLMGASLAEVAATFPESRIAVDGLGRLLGEPGFGPVSQSVFGLLEGLVFGAAVALAIRYWARLRNEPR
ncbi:MAG TPA: transcriptional regulator [Sphingomicrobium sp.]